MNLVIPDLSMADLTARLSAGNELVALAAALAGEHFAGRADLALEHKGHLDWVSDADRRVEEQLRLNISRQFPDDWIVGEEGEGRVLGDGFNWIVDPIDGTNNFLLGLPLWCVSVALAFKRTVVGAWIVNPSSRESFYAALGKGARCNGVLLRCRQHAQWSEAMISIGKIPAASADPHAAFLSAAARAGADFRRLGSAALSMAFVAAGRLDAYYDAELSLWDYAAGALILSEAGGRTLAVPDPTHAIEHRDPILAASSALVDLVHIEIAKYRLPLHAD